MAFEPNSIVIASTQRKWHGGEQQAVLLAQGLRERGWTCRILSRRSGEFAKRLSEQKFDVRTFSGSGLSPLALLKIRRAIGDWKPDIIYLNDGHALRAVGFASLGIRAPLRIAARRVDFAVRSTAKFSVFANGVICVSRAVQQVCRDSGLPKKLLDVVHDGVEPAFGASGERNRGRRSLGLSDKALLLLCVAKLTDHKGHRFLLDAMVEVVREHPSTQLALAGDGELRLELEQQVAKLGLENSVRFLGYRNDVPDLLAAADIVVQPSHKEGLCSSLIDAMFARKAIVATRAGGIPDLFETQGDSSWSPSAACDAEENAQRWALRGNVELATTAVASTLASESTRPSHRSEPKPLAQLVPPRSPAALAEAIAGLLVDAEQRRELGAAAELHASRYFTDDVMVEKTIQSFHRFAAQRGC